MRHNIFAHTHSHIYSSILGLCIISVYLTSEACFCLCESVFCVKQLFFNELHINISICLCSDLR
jgi:hypothetical protein